MWRSPGHFLLTARYLGVIILRPPSSGGGFQMRPRISITGPFVRPSVRPSVRRFVRPSL